MRRIEELAREHSKDALAALLDEAKNGKGAPRVTAAIALLDRAWGKPVERTETGDPGAFDPSKLSDEDVRRQAKEALLRAVKLGVVKVMPGVPSG